MRPSILLTIVFLLAACGFEPVYAKHDGPAGEVGAKLENVRVDAMAGDPLQRRVAQQFAADLEDRIHPDGSIPATPEYRLKTTVGVMETVLAISPDGTVNRSDMNVDASYSLVRVSDGKVVYTGHNRATDAYTNVLNQYYSTYVARQDALRRATTELAEDVRLRLAAYFASADAIKSAVKSS